MNMTSTRDGETETGKLIPAGTVVEYCGHLPGAAVKVKLEDGSEEVMHPACFAELRATPPTGTTGTCDKCGRKSKLTNGKCGTCLHREERRINCHEMWGKGRRGY